MRFPATILLGLFASLFLVAGEDSLVFAQSFSCAAARTADEAMICQNESLAQLDLKLANLYSQISKQSAGIGKLHLADEQKQWLISRRRCGIDVSCIQRAYEERITRLSTGWTGATVPVKILLGPHIGDATIVSLSGRDSDSATVEFRRELDDLIEDCARNLGFKENNDVDARKISDCATTGTRQERGKLYKRRAKCSISTVYTEFGNYTMVNTEKEAESTIDGKPYRPVRTDWKSHRTEQIVGNCSACNTPQLLDSFKVLCPMAYSAYFDGYTPY